MVAYFAAVFSQLCQRVGILRSKDGFIRIGKDKLVRSSSEVEVAAFIFLEYIVLLVQGFLRVSTQILLNEVGHTYFDTHIKENTKGTKCKMLVTHCAFNKVELHGSLLGFFNLGEDNHNESKNEDGEGNHQSRRSIGDFSSGSIGNQSTHKDVASHGCGAVEHTAELDKLVTLVAATAEEVEHGVYHAVEDTHAEACDECADEVNGEHETEVLLCVKLAAVPLDEDADNTDNQADEGRFLVAVFGNQHTGGNTHEEIGEEVAVVADLS